MPELNLLPTNLNIACVAGDDVNIEVYISRANSACGDSSLANITNTTFSAVLKTSNATYEATIVKDIANSKVTATWSDTQTALAGAGSWKWWMTFTDANITRTRVSGEFRGVIRG